MRKPRFFENYCPTHTYAVFIGLLLAGIGPGSAQSLASADRRPSMEMWRLDCGLMVVDDISFFSDTFSYDGKSASVPSGCYLIRHGEEYLLWDAGLPESLIGNKTSRNGWANSLKTTIVDQLKRLNLKQHDISLLAISHHHGDHIGQAPLFDRAKLLISAPEADWIRSNPDSNAFSKLSAWFERGAPMKEYLRDHDVFGDGTVTILATPGHTPGHSSLLVQLPDTGPVLLTGDLFHFRAELGTRNVSRWNTSRADTLASIERFHGIVESLDPIVIIPHEELDTKALPAFPHSAK